MTPERTLSPTASGCRAPLGVPGWPAPAPSPIFSAPAGFTIGASQAGPPRRPVKVHMKAFTFEMHHTRADFTNPGENIGLNITGLDMINMPGSGDVIVCTDFTVKMHHTRSDFASSGATLA